MICPGVGNLGKRVGFRSIRLTWQHVYIQLEADSIINQVEKCNTNTTRLLTKLPDTDSIDMYTSSEEEGSSLSEEEKEAEAEKSQTLSLNRRHPHLGLIRTWTLGPP
jgi:hypothetical protein